MIEYYHRERSRQAAASSKDGAPVDREESDVFLGLHRGDGTIMVAPALMSFVAKEMEAQSAIDKQSRKAREERALRRK